MKPEVAYISFIIISYNRPADTIAAIKNVLELEDVSGYQKEIVVINNGSTDTYQPLCNFLDSLSVAEREMVIYHHHSENLGVAKGRNLGISMAKGNLLIFMDDDAGFTKTNIIPIALRLLEQYETSHHVKIIAFREFRTATQDYYIATKNKKLAQQSEFLTNYYIGSGHLIKREVFDTVGNYTTEFFYGMEEYDLAYKALDAGFRILYTDSITVWHKKSPEGREGEVTLTRWNLENKTVVAYKYLPWVYVLTHLVFWSGYFLWKSGFRFLTLLTAFRNLFSKIRRTPRRPISEKTLQYIHSVKGRLWY
ncbi:MAG: glycosyltransferase family 2 protein [Sphingobacteriales bacterium]|nr:MAG: glycosyltransferase family 2 protein [Sphingobacteriales bacterium]